MSEEWTGFKASFNTKREQELEECKCALIREVKELRTQLVAAQQQILNREARWEETEKLYKYSLDQLAAAQAAMAEVEEHNIRGAIHPDVLARHIASAKEEQRQADRDELAKLENKLAAAQAAFSGN